MATISVIRRFVSMAVLSPKELLVIAVVVDVALQKHGKRISARTLAARHGLPSRHLELCSNHWCTPASSKASVARVAAMNLRARIAA